MSKVSEFRAQAKTASSNGEHKVDPATPLVPFNPREFMVPATGKNKIPPVPMHFKSQQGHAHEAAKIVAGRIFPYYDTTSDLIRHAFQRHLAWLHTLGAPTSAEWLQTEAIIELTREQVRQHNFSKYLEDLRTTVDRSIEMGMRSEARLLVFKVRLLVAQMSEGKWKERWEQELKGKFTVLEEQAADGKGGGA